MSDWQPIETAPKEAYYLLLLANNRVEIGRWDDDRFAKKPKPFWAYSFLSSRRQQRENPPTHWMPLPTPPK